MIEPFAEADVDVVWTPQATGKLSVRAHVAAEGDADASNDYTTALGVTVLDGGKWVDAAKEGMALFDTPFEYSGGNLAMMTRKDNGAKLSGVYFMSQNMLNDRDRHSWCHYDAAAFDFPSEVKRFYKDRPSVSFFVNKDVSDGIGTASASENIDVNVSGKTLFISTDEELNGKLIGSRRLTYHLTPNNSYLKKAYVR